MKATGGPTAGLRRIGIIGYDRSAMTTSLTHLITYKNRLSGL